MTSTLNSGLTHISFPLQVQERERGITIQSAAVNFNWRDHTVGN